MSERKWSSEPWQFETCDEFKAIGGENFAWVFDADGNKLFATTKANAERITSLQSTESQLTELREQGRMFGILLQHIHGEAMVEYSSESLHGWKVAFDDAIEAVTAVHAERDAYHSELLRLQDSHISNPIAERALAWARERETCGHCSVHYICPKHANELSEFATLPQLQERGQ